MSVDPSGLLIKLFALGVDRGGCRMLIIRGYNDFFHYDLVLEWKHSIKPIVFSKENFKNSWGNVPP